MGSGNPVHNLHTYAWGRYKVEPFDWAVRFEERAREPLLASDHDPLIAYETLGSLTRLQDVTPPCQFLHPIIHTKLLSYANGCRIRGRPNILDMKAK